MKWTEEQYEGKKLYFGKYIVARVNRSSIPEYAKTYKAYCLLPGIKEFLGYFPTVKEAAEKIDGAVGLWLTNTRLKEQGE